ncbi:structural cement protein Gp24 [Alicyclobacillus macrosporangiidus]|uniref:Uncharacterized protein n=1 Tax=Alicyclobacillus macrosporangiidus TaxID=392015 RepID=A0A1I7IDI7_9BACL|nr:hypothetical protein [Alicyclobacillus macrosporangiidus]SFU70994.1 hypothetical protein SAMN05421543_106154 [Alicyclobacillus macrosporangiidus]
MPGSVVGKTLNLGYPGNVSRSADAVIVNRPVRSTDSNPIPFGAPVVLNSDNTYSLFGATNTAADFAGVAIREVKQATSYLSQPYGQTQYNPGDPCDVIERGSVTVTCNVGTPVAGGPVYIRVAANASIPNGVVGGFEAAADGTNTVQLTNVQWKTGKIDANNTAEITILSRNKA